MAFGFFLPTKAAVTFQWIPDHQSVFPVVAPVSFPEQLFATTAGGSLYVQEKGAALEKFELVFELMTQTDVNSLKIFFQDQSQGALKTFEYEDGEGTTHKVRWMNDFNFARTHVGFYAGTIELRKVP